MAHNTDNSLGRWFLDEDCLRQVLSALSPEIQVGEIKSIPWRAGVGGHMQKTFHNVWEDIRWRRAVRYPYDIGMEVVIRSPKYGMRTVEISRIIDQEKGIMAGVLAIDGIPTRIQFDHTLIRPRFYEGGATAWGGSENGILNGMRVYEKLDIPSFGEQENATESPCPHCSFIYEGPVLRGAKCRMCTMPMTLDPYSEELSFAVSNPEPEIPPKIAQLRRRILHLADVVTERLTEDRRDPNAFLERLRASEMDLKEMWQTLFSMDATALEWLSTTPALDIVMNNQYERLAEDLSAVSVTEQQDDEQEGSGSTGRPVQLHRRMW